MAVEAVTRQLLAEGPRVIMSPSDRNGPLFFREGLKQLNPESVEPIRAGGGVSR